MKNTDRLRMLISRVEDAEGEPWPGLGARTNTPVNTTPHFRGTANRDTEILHVAVLISLAPPAPELQALRNIGDTFPAKV